MSTTRRARCYMGMVPLAAVGLAMALPWSRASGPADGFDLRWAEGECIDCKIAVELGRLQFTSGIAAWGIGYAFGPVGTGDYIVVHTDDGGRSWREVPQTYQHAHSPAFSFVDALRGWIALWNPADEPRILRTVDGGDKWETVGGQFAQELRFFDGTMGYGAAAASFLATVDGGRTWSKIEVPHLRRIDRLFFLSRTLGWIAGTDGPDFLLFRTADGGRTWQEFRNPAPADIANVADLYFVDSERGWLITWSAGDRGTALFRTANGGSTWTRDTGLSLQGPHNWAGVVRFVSDRSGFVFGTEDRRTGRGSAPPRNVLAYTSDGGEHWRHMTIPHSVHDCQVLAGDLRCSAGEGRSGFFLLTVHLR